MGRHNEGMSSGKTKEFVRDHWPLALLATGTVVGAAIWITARYLRKRKARDQEIDLGLAQAENEAIITSPDVALLELGTFVTQLTGEEAVHAANELEEHLPDSEAQDAMATLGQIAANEISSMNR